MTRADADDHGLVQGLRRGDSVALERAYAKYRPRVYGFLLRLSGRRDVADDLLQETWLKLARAAPDLREDTTLLPLLFTIARNQFISFRRWSVLDVTRLLSFGAENDDVAPSPERESEASARVAVLERALQQLSADAREALVLVAIEGLEQEDAAKVLGIGYAALRQRLSRARAELEERMTKLEARGRRVPAAAARGGTT